MHFSDQIRDWSQVRLPSVLCAARLPAQRGEEADKQREQGPGHRLQRLQAHLLRLSVPGDEKHHKLTLTSLIIASKEAQYLLIQHSFLALRELLENVNIDHDDDDDNDVAGCVHGEVPEEHLQCGAADQGARGRQQRHRLHRRLHRPRAAQPAHHPGMWTQ